MKKLLFIIIACASLNAAPAPNQQPVQITHVDYAPVTQPRFTTWPSFLRWLRSR